jgi:hypothetical protein
MSGRADFIPGLSLGRMLYEEAGRGIVESVVSPDAYAAALIGKGSDVLGFDTERSTDHDWGPRFQVFLDAAADDSAASRLDDALRRRLPALFHGCEVGFSDPDPDDNGTQVPAHAQEGSVQHLVEITTTRAYLSRHIGVEHVSDLTLLDWLTFPEQRLLELTSGEVFHDPRGELGRFRETLGAYPRDVWLYRMACQWQRLSQEEAFVGRCAEAGDAIGMKVMAARITKDVMKLCFLMERKYAPYDKWLGTSFSRLACAPRARPLIAAALDARDYPAMEPNLTGLYRMLGDLHNALGVTGHVDPTPRQFFSRPYTVMRAERFANALLNAVQSEELRRIPVRMGAIDQFVDNTDFIEHAETYRKVLGLYL